MSAAAPKPRTPRDRGWPTTLNVIVLAGTGQDKEGSMHGRRFAIFSSGVVATVAFVLLVGNWIAKERGALPHFECYLAAPSEDPPHVVTLENQFGTEGPMAVGPSELVCLPTKKTVVEGSTSELRPRTTSSAMGSSSRRRRPTGCPSRTSLGCGAA